MPCKRKKLHRKGKNLPTCTGRALEGRLSGEKRRLAGCLPRYFFRQSQGLIPLAENLGDRGSDVGTRPREALPVPSVFPSPLDLLAPGMRDYWHGRWVGQSRSSTSSFHCHVGKARRCGKPFDAAPLHPETVSLEVETCFRALSLRLARLVS